MRYYSVTDQNQATVKPLTDSLKEVPHTPYKVNLKGIHFCNDLLQNHCIVLNQFKIKYFLQIIKNIEYMYM